MGLPYDLGGCGRMGLDCWGLVQLVYREEFEIEVDEHHATERDPEWFRLAGEEYERLSLEWVPTTEPEGGDVLLFRLRGELCHTGLYVSPVLFLHAFNNHPVGLERMTRGWSQRLTSYYRHRSA